MVTMQRPDGEYKDVPAGMVKHYEGLNWSKSDRPSAKKTTKSKKK
jgi:hypothetical protein